MLTCPGSGIQISLMRTLAPTFSAGRKACKIWTQYLSGQSCRIQRYRYRSARYRSAPLIGCGAKKSYATPSIRLFRSARIWVAREEMTSGWSWTTNFRFGSGYARAIAVATSSSEASTSAMVALPVGLVRECRMDIIDCGRHLRKGASESRTWAYIYRRWRCGSFLIISTGFSFVL